MKKNNLIYNAGLSHVNLFLIKIHGSGYLSISAIKVTMNLSTLNSTSQKSFHAVKAIIYRSDNKLLLQKRDDNPEIPYPLHWNLFGGEVEIGEDFLDALKRELNEEIEYSPKLIESEIFQSKWKSIDLIGNKERVAAGRSAPLTIGPPALEPDSAIGDLVDPQEHK